MSPASKVLAVCVNYNGRQVLPALLASLLQDGYPALQVLVVDNASQDGSADSLPEGVQLLRLAQNRGYAGAINAALRRRLPPPLGTSADGPDRLADYFLLLNNDLVWEPGLVGRLVEFAEKRQAGVCGPKILRYSDPGRLDAAWGEVSWSRAPARFRGKNSPDSPQWDRTRPVELLLGCLLLVRRSVFEQAGLFDERFFMYHEEVDFLYRCRQQGISVYYCPFAQALHRGAFSSRNRPHQKTFWLRRNSVLFLRKHRPGPFAWLRFALALAAGVAFNLLTLRWQRSRAILRGAAEGWSSPCSPAEQDQS